jgi:hypothetical protein
VTNVLSAGLVSSILCSEVALIGAAAAAAAACYEAVTTSWASYEVQLNVGCDVMIVFHTDLHYMWPTVDVRVT